MANTFATNEPHMRVCGPLPGQTDLLNYLKFAAGESLIHLTGLSHGVDGLPADLLRATWCIPPRPKNHDFSGLVTWRHNFFDIPRYSGRETLARTGYPSTTRTLAKQSAWGGTMSSNLKNSSLSALITNASANYVTPVFSLPPAQQMGKGLCSGASFDEGSIWTGITETNVASAPLLQGGIIMRMACNLKGYPPLISLFFFGEFLPAEQQAIVINFPVQIKSNDTVFTGVYWSPGTNGVGKMAMYNYIDVTQAVGMQYMDPNPAADLVPNAAVAVGEPPTIGNAVVAVFPALPKEEFKFIQTIATVDVTDKTQYPIGSTFSVTGSSGTTTFSGVRLYTDYPTGGNASATNVVGTYDASTKVTGFKLQLVN